MAALTLTLRAMGLGNHNACGGTLHGQAAPLFASYTTQGAGSPVSK